MHAFDNFLGHVTTLFSVVCLLSWQQPGKTIPVIVMTLLE